MCCPEDGFAMRAALLVAVLLAGCAGSSEPVSLEDAEAARALSHTESGPDGSLRSVTGVMDLSMEFDGEELAIGLDFEVTLHAGDSFVMDMTMESRGDEAVEGTMAMRCTPSQLHFSYDGQEFDAENTRGECLAHDAAGLASFLAPFEGMEGFDMSGLGSFGVAPDQAFPYTDAKRVGADVVASYKGNISEQGFDMAYEGTDTYRNGLLRASDMTLRSSAFDMELDMALEFSYGPRSPL